MPLNDVHYVELSRKEESISLISKPDHTYKYIKDEIAIIKNVQYNSDNL